MIDKKVIKSYPYFVQWLKELGRSVEEVDKLSVRVEVKPVHPQQSQWRAHELTGFTDLGITFIDGQSVERHVPSGTLTYIPYKEETLREIYDQQIAPLMKQIDAIAMQHGFSYVTAFQYADDSIAASCALKASSDDTLRSAWELLDKHVIWEKEEVETDWDFDDYSDGYPDSSDKGDE